MTPKIDPFQTMLDIEMKLTLRDNIVPYSRRSKNIPIEISIKLVTTHCPQQQQDIEVWYKKRLEFNLAYSIPTWKQSNYIHGYKYS